MKRWPLYFCCLLSLSLMQAMDKSNASTDAAWIIARNAFLYKHNHRNEYRLIILYQNKIAALSYTVTEMHFCGFVIARSEDSTSDEITAPRNEFFPRYQEALHAREFVLVHTYEPDTPINMRDIKHYVTEYEAERTHTS